jgi:hypothetical protein
MWAATENVFEYGLPNKEKMFTMNKIFPYKSTAKNAIENGYYGPQLPETGLVSLSSSSSDPMYTPRVPRGLGSFMSSGVGLPQRRGVVRGPSGQFISPSSEEFLQVVPYSKY